MINKLPKQIFNEYAMGNSFKMHLGDKGLNEQSRINERFYVGDQWHGAKCGNERPLVRHNIIKRIGEYKTAVIGANPIAVNFSADGIPNIIEENDSESTKNAILKGEYHLNEIPDNREINFIMSTLSDYFNVTAERVKFEEIKEQALRNAYISGTCVIYTYWDETVPTGLFADYEHRLTIKGDINCEVLDIENLTFGDPNNDNVQAQPYIIIAQRKGVEQLKLEAQNNHRPKYEIDSIRGDRDFDGMAGQRAQNEPENSKKAVVLTKLWKEQNSDGKITVKGIRVTENAVIRDEWDLGLNNYPLAKMSWERRRSSIYGDSEITYLIPNQIAINRALTASVWSMIVMGMPILIKDADVISGNVTNMPGQIIDVNCGGTGVGGAISYLTPPSFSGQFDNMIQSLITNTLSQSGANDAVLGNVRPDNLSAIVAVREAALMPLQTVQNRFYQLCEDVARIWLDFWVHKYGNRKIKISDNRGVWYLPFDSKRYCDLIVSVKVDVGASTLWGEAQVISTLDNLLANNIITPEQYFDRLPKGLVPDIDGLKNDFKQENMAEDGKIDFNKILSALTKEEKEIFNGLSYEEQQQMLEHAVMEAAK